MGFYPQVGYQELDNPALRVYTIPGVPALE